MSFCNKNLLESSFRLHRDRRQGSLDERSLLDDRKDF